uniref:Ig-like domain-containing protein n=1 Tax=Lates calcarifer TaxID=8187 RepID=A0A4W6CMH4_LATCA
MISVCTCSCLCCILLDALLIISLQVPLSVTKKPGEKVTIYCSHSIDDYDRILWYKQSNRELQFLGYIIINTAKSEDGVDVKIDGNANKGQNCTLTIEGLSLNDSAVYFCAASYHSATYHCSSVQKPAYLSLY